MGDDKRYIKKLKKKKDDLKARKAYILSRIRKYDFEIQRAVVKDIWKAIAIIDAKLDMISITTLGVAEKVRIENEASAFGFWKADTQSLVASFGIVKNDTGEYLDDLALPGLFLGPFEIEARDENGSNGIRKCMVLVDETGSGLKLLLDIRVDANSLNVSKIDNINVKPFEAKIGLIKDELRRRIELKDELDAVAEIDIRKLYQAYRIAYIEHESAKMIEKLDDKARKKIRRLRKRFGLDKIRNEWEDDI